jgi:magnesium chelatase family protein
MDGLPFWLIDRADIVVQVETVSAADLILPPPTEATAVIAARVQAAGVWLRDARDKLKPGESVKIDSKAMPLLRDAAEAMKLTARAYHSVVAVAATIAALDAVEIAGRVHVAEALSYRHQQTTAG